MSRIACILLLLLTALAAPAEDAKPAAPPTPAPAPVAAAPAPAPAPASPGSLWRATSTSLYSDVRGRKVGDLITVVVTQQSSSSTTAKHGTSKDMEVASPVGSGWFSGFTGLGLKGSTTTNGSGSNTTSTSVTDRLTVSIAAVLPNGNLRLEGERTIVMEKDTMHLHLTGTARAEDIAPDNTISSTLVAEQHIEMQGMGPIAQKTRPGLLSRILSWIW